MSTNKRELVLSLALIADTVAAGTYVLFSSERNIQLEAEKYTQCVADGWDRNHFDIMLTERCRETVR